MKDALVTAYSSQTEQYHRAFQVFLDHTDQKAKARGYLDGVVGKLPKRDIFIDAGAGNGKVTQWFTDSFGKTYAIEPSDSLRADLKRACPKATVLSEMILQASVPDRGDLVLCSHVFYYLDGKEWMPTLDRLASWVGPDGVLIVILQDHQSDCMKMLRHFFGKSYDLSALGRAFGKEAADRYDVSIESVGANVQTGDFDSAYTVAEFMLNLVPLKEPPLKSEVDSYIRKNFARNGSGFRFSVDQAFLKIRPRNK